MAVEIRIRFRQVLSAFLLAFVLCIPQIGLAQKACSQAHLSLGLSDLQRELEVNTNNSGDVKLWNRYLGSLNSLNEYHQFLGLLRKFHQNEFKVEIGGSKGTILGEDLTLVRLIQTDWVQPLLKFRHQMNPDQKWALLSKFQKITSELRGKNPISHSQWAQLETILRLALFPQTVSSYIDGVPRDNPHLFIASTYFGLAARSALRALPSELLIPARRKISEELNRYLADKSGEQKEHRRNLEAIYHLLHKENFIQFLRVLKTVGSPSKDQLIHIVDHYWRQGLGGFQKAGRRVYGFQKVLESAALIQKELKDVIGDSYIDMYGSFANGKSDRESSDVDIHPGPKLMKAYIETFSVFETNYTDLTKIRERWGLAMPASAVTLSESLTRAERKLAQLLERGVYEPSELLTILPSPPDSPMDQFFEPRVAQFYNPLKIRIYRDRLELHVYDAIEKEELRVIPIPP